MASGTRVRAALVGVSALVLLVTACSEPRPSPETWSTEWLRISSGVPELEELGSPPDKTVCQAALGAVREGPGALLPSPDPAIDAAVHAWLETAEGLLFECDSHGVEHLRFEYDELDILEAEIEAALTVISE